MQEETAAILIGSMKPSWRYTSPRANKAGLLLSWIATANPRRNVALNTK